MNGSVIAVLGILIVGYAMVARGFTAANVTAPMLGIVVGMAFFATGGGTHAGVNAGYVHTLAEITLVVVLFHDASTLRLGRLAHDPGVSLRLLVIGFPLALLMTAGVAGVLLPSVGAAGAWLIAAAITPTDAGLGSATVLNPVVPMRVRRGLNVESGVNDGLATPVVLLSLSALAGQQGTAVPELLSIGVLPGVLALGCSVVVAAAAALGMDVSRRRRLSSVRGRQTAMLFLPLLLLGAAELIGANPFITAFAGGLTFGATSKTLTEEHRTAELLETSTDVLGLVVWFLFGGLLVNVFGYGIRWQWVLIAALALTVLRVLPVWVSMIGTGFGWPTRLFLGWFGPRGLATIVFGLLALQELGPTSPVIADIDGVLAVTVLLSVFAHGLSAGPVSRTFGQWASHSADPVAAEPAGGGPPIHWPLSRGRRW